MEPRLDPPAAGASRLLGYGELYAQWEREHWAVGDLDLTADRAEWAEHFGARSRRSRLFGLNAFLVGEERVATVLGILMRACPREDMRIFLCTQIADEARHAVFFDRYLAAIDPEANGGMAARLETARAIVSEDFSALFDTMLDARVERLAAAPGDLEALVEAITLYHMVLEGMVALVGQHVILTHYEQQGQLAALVEGLRRITRDEHRHVAFGARFLHDVARSEPRYVVAVQRTLDEAVPHALRTLRPPIRGDLGNSAAALQAFARQALERRMKVIGLPVTLPE